MASKRITLNKPELNEFKNNAVLNLNPNGRASIGFGLGKAMVILETLSAICAFLKSDGKSLDADAETKARIEAFAKEFLPKEE